MANCEKCQRDCESSDPMIQVLCSDCTEAAAKDCAQRLERGQGQEW